MRPVHGQRGAALLVALIAAALAAVIATSLIEREHRSLARSEALLATERSWQYAAGMEALSQDLLEQALEGGRNAADIDGVWSTPFDVPGGRVQGRVLDLQGRFNVNALAHPDEAASTSAHAAFTRLLDALDLPGVIADELADWLAGAAVPRPGSAGDAWYAARQPGYRTAGVALAHVSELRWLRSVDAAAMSKLAAHVTVLPAGELRVNVNSTTPKVLAALIPGLEPAAARRVLADGPFGDVDALLSHPRMATLATPDAGVHLAVSSRYWLAQARVVLDGVERDYFRLLGPEGPGYDGFRYFSQGVP